LLARNDGQKTKSPKNPYDKKSRQKSPKIFAKSHKKLTSPKKALNLKKALKTSKLPKNLSSHYPARFLIRALKKGLAKNKFYS